MKMKVKLALAIGVCSALPVFAADGKATYEKECAKCHGTDGKGQTKMGQKVGAKDYTDPKVQDALKDDAAFKAIKNGLKDKQDKVLMKPSEGLSDDDIKAVIKHMRSFKK